MLHVRSHVRVVQSLLSEAKELAAALEPPLLSSFTGEHVGEPRLLICSTRLPTSPPPCSASATRRRSAPGACASPGSWPTDAGTPTVSAVRVPVLGRNDQDVDVGEVVDLGGDCRAALGDREVGLDSESGSPTERRHASARSMIDLVWGRPLVPRLIGFE